MENVEIPALDGLLLTQRFKNPGVLSFFTFGGSWSNVSTQKRYFSPKKSTKMAETPLFSNSYTGERVQR